MAAALDFHEWSREELAELAGWGVYREGRAIVECGGVSALEWQHTVLKGIVTTAGGVFQAEFDMRSRVFPVNRCACPVGRRRQVCAHAIALCIAFQRGQAAPVAPPPVAPAPEGLEGSGTIGEATPTGGLSAGVTSVQVAADGEGLRFRLVLPPNLPAAAQRNAVIVKLEYETASGVVVP